MNTVTILQLFNYINSFYIQCLIFNVLIIKQTRDRQVYFALETCFCACAQKQRIPLVKKNNYYKFDCKIENLSRASGGGIHVLSSEKMITKKKLLQIKNYLQGEFAKGEGNPQPIYIYIFFQANKHPQIPTPYR